MCLLVSQPAGTVFEDLWITDFYESNSDGVGVMWAQDGQLFTVKHLPNNKDELIAFFREFIDGKECAWHLRMRTHGDTDLANCHPYEVISEAEGYPLYLMHNGILHTGNIADKSKSDTWHFIQDYIRPALLENPKNFTAPWFKKFIEEIIGAGNKFVMMDAFGNSVTFNADSGVTWRECWFSNTYAWSADLAGFKTPSKWTSSYSSRLDDLDDDWGYSAKQAAAYTYPLGTTLTDEVDEFVYEFFETLDTLEMHIAYKEIATEDVEDLILEEPHRAYALLDNLANGFVTQEAVLESFGIDIMETSHLKVGMQ